MFKLGKPCGMRMVRMSLSDDAREELSRLGEYVPPGGVEGCLNVSSGCVFAFNKELEKVRRLLA